MGLSALDLVNLAQEPITNDEELWHACSGLFNIQVPRHQVCDCCCAPFDALSHAFFAKSPVALWVGGRGTGKTLMLALLCSLEMVNLEVNCKLIAGSKDQADLVVRYLRREDADITGKLWDSPTAPSLLIDHSVDNKSRLQHVDKWKIEALASSEAAIRGHHPHRLRFDECDVAIRSIIESSTGLTKDKTTPRGEVLQRAQTVYSSTYHNPRGTMWWLLEKAKTEGWPVFRWCYKEALQSKGGWMPDDFIERKKKEVPHHRWLIEYENCEPAGGTRIWTREKLDRIFLRALGEMQGKRDDYFRAWGHKLPPQERRYFHGIDWAKVKDDTVLTTITPQEDFHQCVGWYRMNKIDYDEQLARIAYHIRTHPGDTCHDATTYGQTMHDFLKNHPMLKQYYQSSRAGLEGINFSAQRRMMEVLSKYIKAVEDEKVYFPMIEFLFEEHAYLNDEQITGQKHMPDAIVSAMLAYEASQMFQVRRTTPRPRFIRF